MGLMTELNDIKSLLIPNIIDKSNEIAQTITSITIESTDCNGNVATTSIDVPYSGTASIAGVTLNVVTDNTKRLMIALYTSTGASGYSCWVKMKITLPVKIRGIIYAYGYPDLASQTSDCGVAIADFDAQNVLNAQIIGHTCCSKFYSYNYEIIAETDTITVFMTGSALIYIYIYPIEVVQDTSITTTSS